MKLSTNQLEKLEIELSKINESDSSTGLKDWTIEKYQSLIKQLGEYYKHTVPWQVKETWIIKTAYILHSLLINFDESKYKPKLKENIKNTSSIASALVNDINNQGRLGREFYKDLSDLGDTLLNLHMAIPFAQK